MLRLLLLALLVPALAGCLAGEPEIVVDDRGPDDQAAYWDRPLQMHTDTPPGVATDVQEERRADVVPPGDLRYALLDQAMSAFMLSHDTPAASVAVLLDGKLRYAQGYGHLDEGGTQSTPPDVLMRIASLTKPATAAIVSHLVQQGQLEWNDPVFCLQPEPAPGCILDMEPLPERPVGDARLADLTVRHLVDHQTGWTRTTCDASLFYGIDRTIAEAAGIPRPPPAWRHVQWHMGTPMDVDPGTESRPDLVPVGLDGYCNTGYIMLGLIAETITNTSLAALYDAYLWRPLDLIGDMEPGRTLPEDRNPREPFYKCDLGMRENVYPPHQQVCAADGAVNMEAGLADGGLIGSAEAVGALYTAYANDGGPNDLNGPFEYEAHMGGLPGTATTAIRFALGAPGMEQRGVMVVMFNSWAGREELSPETHVPYQYQILHSILLGAVAEAESLPLAA